MLLWYSVLVLFYNVFVSESIRCWLLCGSDLKVLLVYIESDITCV